MKSVNFVVLGDQSIASEFGKKGTATDLILYDRKTASKIMTWVTPGGFPEKIQPLFQAINLAEHVIFYVVTLDKFVGEQMVALDILKKYDGILSHSYDVDEERLRTMIKGTVLERYKKVPSEKILEESERFSSTKKEGKTRVVVDHCFDVKGVGTVVLGKVQAGTVKKYDVLKIHPLDREVVVKSIQMHDDDVNEAESPARVGLSLKGVKPTEINRGDILSNDVSLSEETEIELDFNKNPYYKGDVTQNQMCLVSVGLQIKPAKFSSISPLRVSLEKPVVCDGSETFVILKPESSGIRILGHGKAK